MSLFIEPVRCQFTPAEWEALTKPIVGAGGHQALLRTILDSVTDDRTAVIEDADLSAAYSYAYDYGNGGYQGRFKAILAAAFRAGWVPPA